MHHVLVYFRVLITNQVLEYLIGKSEHVGIHSCNHCERPGSLEYNVLLSKVAAFNHVFKSYVKPLDDETDSPFADKEDVKWMLLLSVNYVVLLCLQRR